jgi:hypothetical protein
MPPGARRQRERPNGTPNVPGTDAHELGAQRRHRAQHHEQRAVPAEQPSSDAQPRVANPEQRTSQGATDVVEGVGADRVGDEPSGRGAQGCPQGQGERTRRSATPSGMSNPSLGPGTTEPWSAFHVHTALPAWPDSAQRCSRASSATSARRTRPPRRSRCARRGASVAPTAAASGRWAPAAASGRAGEDMRGRLGTAGR